MTDKENSKIDNVVIAEKLHVKMGPFTCFWMGNKMSIISENEDIIVAPKSPVRILVHAHKRRK